MMKIYCNLLMSQLPDQGLMPTDFIKIKQSPMPQLVIIDQFVSIPTDVRSSLNFY